MSIESEVEQENREAYARAVAAATSIERWGEFEIVITRYEPHIQEGQTVVSLDPWRTKPFKRRVGVKWTAVAYRDGKMVYGRNLDSFDKKPDAIAHLRREMRKAFDRIPQTIDRFEAEYARLREALR